MLGEYTTRGTFLYLDIDRLDLDLDVDHSHRSSQHHRTNLRSRIALVLRYDCADVSVATKLGVFSVGTRLVAYLVSYLINSDRVGTLKVLERTNYTTVVANVRRGLCRSNPDCDT